MRVWALNLPQFYETKENNEWWGKGYTEWTAVRKAKPLYKGHVQPMIPLNNNYYDLSKPETLAWQAELARTYGVEGFVYYHYWYQGRHLLEKPCEVLLQHPEIQIGYCFCWANHTWTRAWDGKNHEILVEQTYGGEDEWEEHLQYLLPFFKDPRYIRIDGKPVLFIYSASTIKNGDQRIAYWNKRLQEEGMAGIYTVEHLNTFNHAPSLAKSNAVYEDEPNYSCRFKISLLNKFKRGVCKTLKITDYQSYDTLWKLNIRKNATYNGRAIIHAGFPRWDNSPRKGRNSRVIRGATPVKFKRYLQKLKEVHREDASDILVLNAWNEWGEGAMLEPTVQDGYGYLEAIKEVFGAK